MRVRDGLILGISRFAGMISDRRGNPVYFEQMYSGRAARTTKGRVAACSCPRGTMELSRGPAWRAEPPERDSPFSLRPEGPPDLARGSVSFRRPFGARSRRGIASGGSALQAGTPAMLRRPVGTYGNGNWATRGMKIFYGPSTNWR